VDELVRGLDGGQWCRTGTFRSVVQDARQVEPTALATSPSQRLILSVRSTGLYDEKNGCSDRGERSGAEDTQVVVRIANTHSRSIARVAGESMTTAATLVNTTLPRVLMPFVRTA
jgi:hypothetical protein